MGQTADALDARKAALQQAGVFESPKAGASCIDKLLAAGKTQAEAEAQCTQHDTNVKAGKDADSINARVRAFFKKGK